MSEAGHNVITSPRIDSAHARLPGQVEAATRHLLITHNSGTWRMRYPEGLRRTGRLAYPPGPHCSLSLWRSLFMTGLVLSSELMPPNTVTSPLTSALSTQLRVNAPVKEFWTPRAFQRSLVTLYTSTAVSGVTRLLAPPTSTR